MKIVTAGQTTAFKNSPTCQGLAYNLGDKNLDIADITVDGRYPENGFLVNEVCNEIGYVLNGSGVVGKPDGEYALSPGDAVFIAAGERFYWRGAKLRMLMPCSPAFDEAQHKQVD